MENPTSVATFKKIAVVTGASSGIGAVYADRLAARGYDLILVARRADRLEALSKKILKTYAGANVEVIAADLAKESDLIRVEKVLATNPAVRILVNNAGLARLAPIAQAPVQQSLAQIALNITSVTRLTHAVLPALLSRNDGVIVNIASVLAIHSLPVSSVYSGTKAFADANEIVEGAQGLLNRRPGVEAVKLKNIDIVGPQALQGFLASVDQMIARRTHVIGAVSRAESGLR
jgi:short-subunit dehydrogenase